MKKHPIDELFSNKLNEYEIEPSDKAWEILQAKSKNKGARPKRMYYWSVAAMILVTIGGYFWILENRLPESSELSASAQNNNTVTEILKSHSLPETDIETPGSSSQLTEKIANNSSVNVDNHLQQSDQMTNQPLIENIRQETIAFEKQNQVVGNIASSAAYPDPEVIVLAETTSSNADNQSNSELAIKEDLENKFINEEVSSRVIIATIHDQQSSESISDDVKSEKNNKRIKGIFAQLKNAKRGEEVDWNDVGFNPKIILSKLDLSKNDHEENDIATKNSNR